MINRLHNTEPAMSYTDVLEAYERLKDSLEDQELETIFRYMSELTGVSEDGIAEDLSQRDYDAWRDSLDARLANLDSEELYAMYILQRGSERRFG